MAPDDPNDSDLWQNFGALACLLWLFSPILKLIFGVILLLLSPVLVPLARWKAECEKEQERTRREDEVMEEMWRKYGP